jgi:hypothetical protein
MQNIYENQQAIEIQQAIDSGCIVMSYERLKSEIDSLGYAFDNDMMFNYANTGNENSYLARSEYIVYKGTKIGFANIQGENLKIKKNHDALQELRRNVLCVHRGRIVEF